MPAGIVLAAAVAAVLGPRAVTFVDAGTGTVAQAVALPGDGLGVFAAPDGRVVIPLAAEDATIVAAASGAIERWRGRVFPMFFADFDRMHVVLPGALATLSYPERVPFAQIPLPGVAGARRAACSKDGRLVAVVPPGPDGASLTLVSALEGGTATTVLLDGEATAVALEPAGEYAVAAAGGAIEVALASRKHPLGSRALGSEVRALVFTADGRTVLAGTADGRGGGEVVGVQVDVSAKTPVKERFRTVMPGAVTAISAGDDAVVVLAGDTLVVLSPDGKRVRRKVAMAGMSGVALLPGEARSAVPGWTDARTP